MRTALAALACIAAAAHADPITYQGLLRESGQPANGNYDIRFTFWDDATPGAPDNQLQIINVPFVPVTDGVFTAQLNFGDVFDGFPRWLGVEVRPAGAGEYTQLAGRQRIGDTPVARIARDAWTSQAVTLPLFQAGPPFSPSGGTFVIHNSSTDGYAVGGNGPTWGVIGTSGDYASWPPVPVPTGVHGVGETAGVGGSSSDGTGVYGITTNGIGGEFTVLGAANPGKALFAHTAGTGHAAHFRRTSITSSTAAVLVEQLSPGSNAFGVHSILVSTNPGGFAAALRGQNNGTGGNGIGVWGTHGGTGWGVYGTTAGAGRGVYGTSSGAGGAGVYGAGFSGANAATFSGNVSVTGSISKGSGTFKIDHPLDPANAYLSHAFVESPDMKNIYDGVVTLDEEGRAEVPLPEYFEALNTDFRYQLTCVGGYAPVYIDREVSAGAFAIAGGRPGLKVSWQVTGVRQDAFARANPVVVEQPKPAHERGLYLHPEVHDQPADRGIGYTPRQD
jgi:hypothetical protein